MPIPQLNNHNRDPRSWRNSRKKYYVTRNTPKRQAGGSWMKKEGGGGPIDWSVWRKRLIIAGAATVLAIIVLSLATVAWVSRGLPDPNRLSDREMAQSTKIFDRTGETVLYEIHGEQKRTLVTLTDIPDYAVKATIAMEDKDFYNHGAISIWGTFRGTVLRVLSGKSPQGGSTLTQQFVKNAILTNERTVTRKLKEWILSYRLEQAYSKDEILQMYFNEIPYGSTAYGIEAASQRYFGKNVRDINLAEAAILAALPQAPSRYSPYGPNRELLVGRQHYILDLMVEQGYTTEPKAEAAKQYELEFIKPTANISAPHFVMYVKEALSERYGEKTIEQGGLRIYTTLDLYKQQIAEEVIAEIAPKNEDKYGATNAALVSLDPKTGQILAMVGSRDYFNDEIDGQVNISTRSRQPGSSLKPLVYAAAFLKGYNPNTILYDVVTNFSDDPDNPYEPRNYDNGERGPVSIRQALAGSLNVPAVKALYLVGVGQVLDLARDFGYTTLADRDRFGLSLVLGGGEVKLLEHTNAYGVFAREGLYNPVAGILRVEDKDGNILEEFEQNEKKVIDPNVARMINDVLSDNVARSYVFGESNNLTLGGRPVAAKTGTTNDYRDAWTIGYTPSLVTGVWGGNNNNEEMKRGAGGSAVAAPIWNAYMKRVFGDTPVETFRKPEIKSTGKAVLDGKAGEPQIIKIDRASGLLATEHTPASFILEKTYFKPHNILYYVDKNDPLGPAPSDPTADPQFRRWEERVLVWAEKSASSTPLADDESLPTEFDNLHLPENQPTIELVAPANRATLMEPLLIARINASAPRGINRAEYYINDILLETNYSFPYNLEKNISFLPNGFQNLKARVCDDVDNCATAETEFNLVLEERGGGRGEVSVALSSPQSGLAVTNIDFPILIGLNITGAEQAAIANIYYQTDNGESHLISTIQPVNGSLLETAWLTPPPSGTYKIYGEVIYWDKRTAKTREAVITVNNISTSATSSPQQ